MNYDNEVIRCEIIDWWEHERARIRAECDAMHDDVRSGADERIADLSDRDLFLPLSAAGKEIRRKIESDVNVFNRRLAKTLHESADVSMNRLEGSMGDDGTPFLDSASMLAGGAMAIGSVGLAATAIPMATTTAGFLLFAPVVTISWPVAILGGIGALTLAATAPTLVTKARSRARERLRKGIADWSHTQIVDPSNAASTAAIMNAQIDRVVQARLEAVQ